MDSRVIFCAIVGGISIVYYASATLWIWFDRKRSR